VNAPDNLRCRVVAERESLTSPWWRFYLVNDGGATIASAELAEVRYEWGEVYMGGSSPGVRIADLEAGRRAEIWRDDGGSEMRTDLWLRVTHQGADIWLLYEFPRLYRQTGTTLEANAMRMQRPPGALGSEGS